MCKGVLVLLLVALTTRAAEERIWIDAKVDKTPVKTFLDTGASEFYLFRAAAERLGIDLPEKSDDTNNWKMYWADERRTLEFATFRKKIRPAIAEPPRYINVDGIDGFIGWRLIQTNIVQFKADELKVTFPPVVSKEAKSWTRLRVQKSKPNGWKRWNILALETPADEIIIIDTGSSSGVGLPAARWEEWKRANPKKPITLETVAMPSAGLFARERSHADSLTVGPLTLTDVVVAKTEPWSQGIAKHQHAATFGIAALKRMDLIVDGRNGWAYVRAK